MIRKIAKELGVAFLIGLGTGIAEVAVEEGYKAYRKYRKKLRKRKKKGTK